MKKPEPKKAGRPPSHDLRARLPTMTFRLDAETQAALNRLVEHAKQGAHARHVNSIKSAVIREALIGAANRLSDA